MSSKDIGHIAHTHVDVHLLCLPSMSVRDNIELFADNDDDVRKAVDEFKMSHPVAPVFFYKN